jgi:hypothetical protein
MTYRRENVLREYVLRQSTYSRVRLGRRQLSGSKILRLLEESDNYSSSPINFLFQNIAYRQDVDSMKEMEALVTKGRKWSNFVDDIWREHQKHSYQLTVCQEIKNSKSKVRKFKVSNPDKSQIHEVTITIDGSEPPSCTCGRFKSTLIPCGGIGVGVGRCNEALYMDNNLVSR